MGDTDYLAQAHAWAYTADGYQAGSTGEATALAAARSYALVSIAESLRELATHPYAVPGAVETGELDDRTFDDPIPYRLAPSLDRDALIRTAAAEIDRIGRDGEAGQIVHDVGRLGLDYAKHWPTAVAIDTAIAIVASHARRTADASMAEGGGAQ